MGEGNQNGVKRIEIRKYPNRRYYDSTHSRHVTLEEIYSLIRDGHEVQVTDSKSGQDITAKVLAQIIIELDPPKLDAFPVPLLHRLLRSNEQLVGDFITKYFNQPLTAFLDSQRNFEQHLRHMMGLQAPTPTVADWAKVMWEQFNPTFFASQRVQAEAPAATAASPLAATRSAVDGGGEDPDLRRVVDELRQQITGLQEQLGKSNSKKPTAKGRQQGKR